MKIKLLLATLILSVAASNMTSADSHFKEAVYYGDKHHAAFQHAGFNRHAVALNHRGFRNHRGVRNHRRFRGHRGFRSHRGARGYEYNRGYYRSSIGHRRKYYSH